MALVNPTQYNWDTSQRRKEYLRSGGLAVSRKNWHPQLGWERNLQLSETMVPGKWAKQT